MANLSNIKFPLMFFFLLLHVHLSICERSAVTCTKEDEEALLKFLSFSVKYAPLFLPPTIKGDCCIWPGVVCSETSGHVIKLELYTLYGTSRGVLDPSLLELKNLYYLDLSYNDFKKTPIPNFIGEMKQLQYLDLSYSSFSGTVPPHLGNLTKLSFLNLGSNYALHVDDHMEWIYNLSSLRKLDLSLVNLKAAKALNLIKVLNALPFLKHLYLYQCQLHHSQFFYSQNSSQVILTPLRILDLSNNSFVCSVPSWIGNITSLVQLNLAFNRFDGVQGGLLSIIRNTCRLQVLNLSNNDLHGNLVGTKGNLSGTCSKYDMEYLDLGSNKLNGSLPSTRDSWLPKLKNLKRLDLSSNSFSGPMLENLGQLRSLEELIIHHNYFEGDVLEAHFANLSKLRWLQIGNHRSSVDWKIRSDWIPPFSLETLSLQFLNTNGSEVPRWIRTQNKLYYLDLSNSDITGTIPTWLGELSNLDYLDLSNNQLKGSIIPLISLQKLQQLYLAHNQINGTLPTLCKMADLFLLDISENRLWGNLPNCWSIEHNSYLTIISLSSNQLSGCSKFAQQFA